MSVALYKDENLQWNDMALRNSPDLAGDLITRTGEERLLWFVSVVDQLVKLYNFIIRCKYIR